MTAETWLRDLAGAAFNYERRLFDEPRGNWPDLRYYSTWKATELLPPSFQTVWCHGAGGIGLARLRCYELTGEDRLRLDAVRAAATLNASLATPDVAGDADIGLCHGRAGRLDLLRTLAAGLHNDALFASAEDETGRLADLLCDATADVDLMPVRAGLMLGKAGVGWFFARNVFAGLSSPLLPIPVTHTTGHRS